FRNSTGISDNEIVAITEFASRGTNKVAKIFFGITHHAVFMDFHFDGYNHSVSVVYIEKDGSKNWLPLTDKVGSPGNYIFGFNWVNWTFRVNAPSINHEQLLDGLKDYTAFWAHKNGIELDGALFKVKVKKNKV